MTTERYRTGAVIAFRSEQQLSLADTPLTALGDVELKIHRESDDQFFDFDDDTFKAAGHVMIALTMLAVSVSNVPGIYRTTWDTSVITNPVANDKYFIDIQSATAANPLALGEVLLGDFVDAVYQMQIQLIRDIAGVTDRYTAVFFKDTEPVTIGITGTPTLQVINAADGVDLIPASAMTEIPVGSGRWRYDAVTTQLQTKGVHYIARVVATIDGGAQDWHRGIGRDST